MERDANPYANERGEEPLGAPGAPLKSDLMKRVHPNGKLMHPELHPSHPDYRGPGSKPAAPPPPSSLLDGSSPWVILGFVILAAIWVYQRKGTPKRPQSTTVHADDLALLDKLRTGRALHEALEHSISKIEITPETAFGKAGVSFICDETKLPTVCEELKGFAEDHQMQPIAEQSSSRMLEYTNQDHEEEELGETGHDDDGLDEFRSIAGRHHG